MLIFWGRGGKMYRFRSVENLMGEFKELETETIFFAPPYKLNDPMEGYKNIIFKGDNILWENMLKNYINDLLRIVLIFYVDQEYSNLENEIATYLNKNIMDAPIYTNIQRVNNKLLNQKITQVVLSYILTKKSIRRFELQYLLAAIHPFVLKIVMTEIFESLAIKDIFGIKDLDLKEEDAIKRLQNDFPIISGVSNILQEETIKNENKDVFLANANDKLTRVKNYNLIHRDFSKYYIKMLETLIEPKWFTACFMSHYSNSSLWGSYGNNHTGVCLEYKATKDNDIFVLDIIKEKKSWFIDDNRKEIQLQQINYDDSLSEIDFFSFLIKIIQKKEYIKNQWFCNENGIVSDYYKRFEADKNKWLNEYNLMWEQVSTSKDNVWRFENEYRLILNDFWEDYPKEGIKLKYDFNDLVSITFGINTKEIEKYNIIKIIVNKCIKYNIDNFKFYQAYYDATDGNIKRVEIPALISFVKHLDDMNLYNDAIEKNKVEVGDYCI